MLAFTRAAADAVAGVQATGALVAIHAALAGLAGDASNSGSSEIVYQLFVARFCGGVEMTTVCGRCRRHVSSFMFHFSFPNLSCYCL